jgi:penicillin amidase
MRPDERDDDLDPLNATAPELRHRAPESPLNGRRPRRWPLILGSTFVLLILIALGGFFYARHWMQTALTDDLPVLDGNLTVHGLAAPVTVARDARGVPHISAASVDDLVFAQAYVTASDRLWQMDALRRHAAGELAEILGPSLVAHDKMQRTLQLRAAADRAVAVLPPDQMRWLEDYARGVNASIAAQRQHLPLEFRLLRYKPATWTPRDSILVGLAMFQDLTTTFPEKLDREALAAKLAPDLIADLYPVGSWRDHPVAQPSVDLTAPQPEIKDVPLDESQSALRPPSLRSPDHLRDLLATKQLLASASARYLCDGCLSGSNGWAVSGAKTRSGKPILSSDMHLAHNVPGIWYMADLQSKDFHVAGVTLPGTPFVIVGHNQHIAWGFTNLGADVQDLLIEQTRGTGSAEEFQSADGSWHPVLHQSEIIRVKGQPDVILDVPATQHNGMITPIISGLYPHETRSISLRWTIYDPANVTSPFFAINSASDWTSLCAAASTFGGPAQNLQYADDQGHIGYHAIGRVPVRGGLLTPTPLSPVPTDARQSIHDWVGYIPFDQMPQSFDPPGGIVATANSRVVPDNYPFPITLDWADPYRNQRIWKVLTARSALVPADMLALQTDTFSDLDRVIAQRLAYAIDHTSVGDSARGKRLRLAADLLRLWDGNVTQSSSAAAITDATRAAFWPLILAPQLGVSAAPAKDPKDDPFRLYSWGEKAFAEEQIILNAPPHWLPAKYHDWNELLTAAVEKAIVESDAPADLTKWHFGDAHSLDIEHPIYSQNHLLNTVLGVKTGTGIQPQSGDGSTIKQVGRTFGPSERLTVDFSDLDRSTLNIVLGESADPESPWFMDQFPAWYNGTTFTMPFSSHATTAATTHTLTLEP